MTRTVTIDGREVAIETGVTLHKRGRTDNLRRRDKGPFRKLLESLRPGESVLLPFDTKTAQSKSVTMRAVAKSTGRSFAYRREGNSYRYYCLDNSKTEQRSNGAIAKLKALASEW